VISVVGVRKPRAALWVLECRIFSLSSSSVFTMPLALLRLRGLHHWNRTAEAHPLIYFPGLG